MFILGAAQSGGSDLNALFEFIHKWKIHATEWVNVLYLFLQQTNFEYL